MLYVLCDCRNVEEYVKEWSDYGAALTGALDQFLSANEMLEAASSAIRGLVKRDVSSHTGQQVLVRIHSLILDFVLLARSKQLTVRP